MTMIEFLQIISYIAVIAGVPIAIYQISLTRKIAEADLERRKKESTIVFTDEIISRTDNINGDILKIFGNDTINSSDERYKDNDEIQESVKQYLKLMERLSVGINSGVYDVDVFSRICGRKIIESYDRLCAIIREKRTSLDNRWLYEEFEDMVGTLGKIYRNESTQRGDLRGLIRRSTKTCLIIWKPDMKRALSLEDAHYESDHFSRRPSEYSWG